MKKAASVWRPFFVLYLGCCSICENRGRPHQTRLRRAAFSSAREKNSQAYRFFLPPVSAVFLKPMASCVPSARARASVTRRAQ